MSRIRKAVVEDVTACVDLLYISGPAIYRYSYAFDEPEIFDYMASQFVLSDTLLSVDYAYVEVDDHGRIKGVMLGYPIIEMNRIVKAMSRQLVSFLRTMGFRRFMTMLAHMDLNRYFPKTDKNEFFICNLAVHEDFRRQGVGQRLLEKAQTLAREEGLPKLSLFVEVDNPGAIKLYEKYGFKVTNSSLLPRRFHKRELKGFYKMVKELD